MGEDIHGPAVELKKICSQILQYSGAAMVWVLDRNFALMQGQVSHSHNSFVRAV